jgi:hypothetical protein
VLSVIHDGRTFITGPVTPGHPHNDLSLPKTQQIDEPEDPLTPGRGTGIIDGFKPAPRIVNEGL